MDDFISRGEHEEFARRVEEENTRQNHRLQSLEENMKEISKLTISVEKMAVSTESMAKELGKQGERLDAIESKPAQHWNTVITGILGAIAGAIGVAIIAAIAHFI